MADNVRDQCPKRLAGLTHLAAVAADRCSICGAELLAPTSGAPLDPSLVEHKHITGEGPQGYPGGPGRFHRKDGATGLLDEGDESRLIFYCEKVRTPYRRKRRRSTRTVKA